MAASGRNASGSCCCSKRGVAEMHSTSPSLPRGSRDARERASRRNMMALKAVYGGSSFIWQTAKINLNKNTIESYTSRPARRPPLCTRGTRFPSATCSIRCRTHGRNLLESRLSCHEILFGQRQTFVFVNRNTIPTPSGKRWHAFPCAGRRPPLTGYTRSLAARCGRLQFFECV